MEQLATKADLDVVRADLIHTATKADLAARSGCCDVGHSLVQTPLTLMAGTHLIKSMFNLDSQSRIRRCLRSRRVGRWVGRPRKL